MRISAKADYAVRAAAELAAAEGESAPMKGEELARRQSIPKNFLENILTELRRAGIVRTRRGAEGGYPNHRPAAAEITVADVLPVIRSRRSARLRRSAGSRPEQLAYEGTASSLPDVCGSRCASLQSVLGHASLADIASGKLPAVVEGAHAPVKDSWKAH
jgi:Rrf2 family protein